MKSPDPDEWVDVGRVALHIGDRNLRIRHRGALRIYDQPRNAARPDLSLEHACTEEKAQGEERAQLIPLRRGTPRGQAIRTFRG